MKTKKEEEKEKEEEMIYTEYHGKPYAIYIALLLALGVTIVGAVYIYAFILDKITKAGIL